MTSLSILLHTDTDAATGGGVNEGVRNLGHELEALDVQVGYLYGRDDSRRQDTYLESVPRPVRLYDPGLGALRLIRRLHELATYYDILHSHGSIAIFDAVVASRLSPASGWRARVATLHGTDHGVLTALQAELHLGHEPWNVKKRALLAHFGLAVAKEHYAYPRVQALLARSPGIADEARHWFGVAATPICPGTDTTKFAPATDSAGREIVRRRIGLEPRDLAVLAVGKPAYRKGTRYLAEAVIQAGPPFRLVTIGAEPEIGGAGALILGQVPHDDLPTLYQACDIYCLPSTYEAFGLVLLDAMATGLPCVSTDTAGGQAMIRDGENGLLVSRRDVPALVAALHRLRDPDERRRLGVAARETALQFTWRREAELTLAWYHAVLGR